MATAWPSFFWEMDALESQFQRLLHVDKWFVKSKFSPLALRESSYFLSCAGYIRYPPRKLRVSLSIPWFFDD
jgi:hypothetical protein